MLLRNCAVPVSVRKHAGPFVLLSITLVRAGLTLMVLCGTYLLLGGELSLLVFVLFLVVGSRVFDPLTSALTNFAEFRYFSIAGGRILTLMNEPEMEGERQAPATGDIRSSMCRSPIRTRRCFRTFPSRFRETR